MRRALRPPEMLVVTAWETGKLVGFAIIRFHHERAHLNLLAVDPGYRRFGVGAGLIEWLEKTARTGGIFFINLEVPVRNTVARVFYQRLGYQETEPNPRYYADRETAICMLHDLRVQRPFNTV